MQVDGKYVGWTERTQYIEIYFNREIRLCYTWRRTPYISNQVVISEENSLLRERRVSLNIILFWKVFI
jgi:hypothetical protein